MLTTLFVLGIIALIVLYPSMILSGQISREEEAYHARLRDKSST